MYETCYFVVLVDLRMSIIAKIVTVANKNYAQNCANGGKLSRIVASGRFLALCGAVKPTKLLQSFAVTLVSALVGELAYHSPNVKVFPREKKTTTQLGGTTKYGTS